MLTRRDFMFGAGAFAAAPVVAGVAPLVRFGVVTDVHYADS